MSKWILLVVVCVFCGCASHRTKITVTRVDGQPAVSIEFEDRK